MTEQNSKFDSFEMQLNHTSKGFLDSAGRWAYFLGIVGFIFSALMLIVSVFIGIAFSAFSPEDFGGAFGGAGMPLGGGTITAIYVVLGVFYGVFSYYLFNFGSQMKRAQQTNDTKVLQESLGSLKIFFKIWGVMTIVFISLYIILILGMTLFS